MAHSPTNSRAGTANSQHSRRAASTSRVEQIINLSPMLLAASPPSRTVIRASLRSPIPIAESSPTPNTPPPASRQSSVAQRNAFTPRVVRAVSTPIRQPQTRLQRALSLSGHMAPSPITLAAPSSAPNPQLVLPDPPASFPLPSYLRISAIHDHLSSESTPFSSPNQFRFDVQNGTRGRVVSNSADSDDESTELPFSQQPDPSTHPRSSLPTLPLRLPTQWSSTDRHSSLTVSVDGAELLFTGPPLTDNNQAASVRANYPIPPGCGIYYYEVEVVNKGTKGHISIGFSSRLMRLNKLPGWETQSWGYHADDGNVFVAERDGKPFGPTYTNKDVIGCGIDFSSHRMFYTKNGEFINFVFEKVGEGCDIFPSVGMRHASESLRANFGQLPFRFDIEGFVRTEQRRVWSSIQSTEIVACQDHDAGSMGLIMDGPIPPIGDSSLKMPELDGSSSGRVRDLVLNYLTHHGYTKAARELKEKANERASAQNVEGDEMDLDSDLEATTIIASTKVDGEESRLDSRLRIISAIQRGDIDTALSQAEEHYPQVLEAEQGLMKFKLRCRKFVELLRKAADIQRQSQTGKVAFPSNGAAADEGIFEMELDHPQHAESSRLVSKGKARGDGEAVSYERTFQEALDYWQTMEVDYKHDPRPQVQDAFRRTFSLIAFEDPLAATGEPSQLASDEARFTLAEELNDAILTLDGHPLQPKLELVYRQTALCLRQLAYLGVGAAAFADVRRELIESNRAERLQ